MKPVFAIVNTTTGGFPHGHDDSNYGFGWEYFELSHLTTTRMYEERPDVERQLCLLKKAVKYVLKDLRELVCEDKQEIKKAERRKDSSNERRHRIHLHDHLEQMEDLKKVDLKVVKVTYTIVKT
jgi:hypothetical protein